METADAVKLGMLLLLILILGVLFGGTPDMMDAIIHNMMNKCTP
jgi:hypothetical protein